MSHLTSKLKLPAAFLVGLAVVVVAGQARAAALSLSSPAGAYRVGDQIPVTLNLDSQGQAINTMSGTVTVPLAAGKFSNLESGRSVVTLWVTGPSINATGTEINFAGGVPGGYSGSRGPLFSFVIEAKKAGSLRVSLAGVKIFPNDGQGTPLSSVTVKPLELTIISAAGQPVKLVSLPADLTPPEAFTPVVDRNDALAGGRYFVAFNAVDKGRGIDHYAVSEVPFFFLPLTIWATAWTPAENPYILTHQWRPEVVRVRAYDRGGNYRDELVMKPPAPFLVWAGIVIFGLLLSILLYRRIWRRTVLGLVLVGVAGWGLAAPPTLAASIAAINLTPPEGRYQVGDLFSVVVSVDTADQPVNAVAGQLQFDSSRLAVTGLSTAYSLFNLWSEKPNFSNNQGTVNFSGGLPSPGFQGSAGEVLRITFKARAPGQAAVSFASGSLLANDGQGTNILSRLNGAQYQILAAVSPSTSLFPAVAIPATSTPILGTPIIVEYPNQLTAGGQLVVRGLSDPNSLVAVFYQKNSGPVLTDEVPTAVDGRFISAYTSPIQAGSYRVWAKTMSATGVMSNPSDTVSIQVVPSLYFKIGNLAINFVVLIVILVALIALALLLLAWFWYRVRQRQLAQGKQVSAAERAVHRSFADLRVGLADYLNYLIKGQSVSEVETREHEMRSEMEKKLAGLEEKIEAEIEEIDQPKP